jgi:hypothetical protein
VVYELFYTALPPGAFTPADIVALHVHRGAFETVLADEDKEQDPDRWCSQTAWGQEFWLILAQWMWNLRLELGHTLSLTPMRTTEFAPVQVREFAETAPDPVFRPAAPPPVIYGPPQWHVHRTPKALPEPISRSSLMGRCAVQQVARSIYKSGDRSAMGRFACSILRGSAIVAHVRFVSSVKHRRPPAKRDGSVQYIGGVNPSDRTTQTSQLSHSSVLD